MAGVPCCPRDPQIVSDPPERSTSSTTSAIERPATRGRVLRAVPSARARAFAQTGSAAEVRK